MDSKLSLAFLLAFVTLSGCNSASDPATLEDAVGHFEGFEVKSNGGISTQVSVGADVSASADGSLSVKIQTEPASLELDLQMSVAQNSALSLSSSSGLFSGVISLSPGQQNCFDSGSAASPTDELCVSGNEIRFFMNTGPGSGIKFVLDKMPARTLPKLETPAKYTIDALVQRSMNQSFTTLSSFESLMQAKLSAQQATLNLLPHININSALDLVGLSLLTMVRGIGDLVPFILPDRWFETQQLQDQSAAEVNAYKVVQASAMTITRGLALSVLRDEESLRKLSDDEVQIMQIRDQVVAAEQSGGHPLGQEATINVLLDKIDNSILALKEAITQGKASLSQAAGFNNPLAVSEVDSIGASAIAGPITGDLAAVEAQATSRSLQLIEADEMIQAAQAGKAAAAFQWLDPTGSDSGSLGFGFVDNIKVQQAQVDQLMVSRSATQAQILVQVQSLLSQSRTLYQTYQNDLQASQQSQESVQLYLNQFQDGVSFDMSLLAAVLGQKTNSDVAQIQDIYADLTLRDQLDFLTFSGAYASLIGETP